MEKAKAFQVIPEVGLITTCPVLLCQLPSADSGQPPGLLVICFCHTSHRTFALAVPCAKNMLRLSICMATSRPSFTPLLSFCQNYPVLKVEPPSPLGRHCPSVYPRHLLP